MKELIFLLLILASSLEPHSQVVNCTFNKPVYTIHFGAGNVTDINSKFRSYSRVRNICPDDGNYAYTSYTEDCFNATWFTLTEDHTAGDASGNMMLVNSSYYPGPFLKTGINILKSGTIYEFGVWIINVYKISNNCPYPLLPDISVQLQTITGNIVAQINTGEIPRTYTPQWIQYRVAFTTPPSETSLVLVMINNNPGGCGNDFALDDITFRECIKPAPVVITIPNKTTVQKKQPPPPKVILKKAISEAPPVTEQVRKVEIIKPSTEAYSTPSVKPKAQIFPTPPPILRTRENTVAKKIEAEPGEITIDLYDNGEIDGDTVSIYHNNELIMQHARLGTKPISIHILMDSAHPHHELVMVAENLGAIPPNTSLMIITAGSNRYEVHISSNEQRNAKVIFNLKE